MRLLDEATPLSAQNFMNYVNDGDYVESFFHRSVPGFVLQGGGYIYTSDEVGPVNIPEDSPVLNEPGISNVRGTIAYAKLGGNPNSATSEWFVNLSHNTDNLDNQNGGFTVFAVVLGDGMQVVDAIASLPTVNAGGAFSNLPVRNFSGNTVLKENLAIVNSITPVAVAAGDYNFDGIVDAADLNKWASDFGELNLSTGDFDDDKRIDDDDFLRWEQSFGISNATYADGDANGNRRVEGSDFLDWMRGFNSMLDVSADSDGNAKIDGGDFLQWQRDFGTITAALAIQNVPEPATGLLVALGASCLTCFRLRR